MDQKLWGRHLRQNGFRLRMNAWQQSCITLDEPRVILDSCMDDSAGLRFVRGANGTLQDVKRLDHCLNVATPASWLSSGSMDVIPYKSLVVSPCLDTEGHPVSDISSDSSHHLPAITFRFVFENDGTIHPIGNPKKCLNVDGSIGPVYLGFGFNGDGKHIIVWPCSADINEVWRADGPGLDWSPHIADPSQQKHGHMPPMLGHVGLIIILVCLSCCVLGLLARSRCCCCRALSARGARLLESPLETELNPRGRKLASGFATLPNNEDSTDGTNSEVYVALDAAYQS